MATSMPELLKRARLEQFALCDSVVADSSSIDSAKRSKFVRLSAGVEYVQHRTVGGESSIGYQQAVAAPRNRFVAHDHGRLESGEAQKIFQSVGELARLHVVRIGPEARVSPLGVARLAPPTPPAAERWHVGVSGAGVDHGPLEVLLRKVGVPRRCWKGAHIDQMCRAFP